MNDKINDNASMMYPSHNNNSRMIIRAGKDTMSFVFAHDDGKLEYMPYIVRSGVSMAANLRQAFREVDMLNGKTNRALLSVYSPVALVPVDEYMDMEQFDAELIYNNTFTGHTYEDVVTSVVPELNAVAVFGVNKDLKMVVGDHFSNVRIQNVIQPVWAHFYRRSNLVGQRRKLYAYFHDYQVDIFSFQQRRFRFSNEFDASHAHDALYYILYVWKQLAMSNTDDELHLIGDTEHMEWLLTKLRTYLSRVYTANPTAELNRAPISTVNGVEFDMMLSVIS